MQILKPLSDQTVEEGKPFTFTCEVTKPNAKARWLRDGLELTPEEGYEIIVDGKTHTLTKKVAELNDKGKFTAVIEGKSTAATLNVTGKVVEEIILHVY